MKKKTTAQNFLKEPVDSEAGGIVRGLAGPGANLDDAFSILEKAPSTIEVTVHPYRQLRGARFNLKPEHGSGYFDLTRGEHQSFQRPNRFGVGCRCQPLLLQWQPFARNRFKRVASSGLFGLAGAARIKALSQLLPSLLAPLARELGARVNGLGRTSWEQE
jgi:hypothetical protein